MTRSGQPALSAFFLVGPTAVGKSAVAQLIAEREGWNILSADSMQVYEGMDIGTAKPTRDERVRARYLGLDLTTADKTFNVWEYSVYARSVLGGGGTSIVSGGSGLYVKSLTHGLAGMTGADDEARKRWDAVLEEQGVEALREALRQRSPALYRSLESKDNPRRLIRALELSDAGARSAPAEWQRKHGAARLVGLARPAAELHERIDARVRLMYRSGLVEEVESLLEQYGELSGTARQAIGYAEAMDLLRGNCTREEAMEKTVIRTRQLAKKQGTWFRNQAEVEWVDIGPGTATDETADGVSAAWKRLGPTEIVE